MNSRPITLAQMELCAPRRTPYPWLAPMHMHPENLLSLGNECEGDMTKANHFVEKMNVNISHFDNN